MLAVGIFGNDNNAAFAGYHGSANGHHPFRTGEQFGVQLVGICVIVLWAAVNAVVMFTILLYTVGLRISDNSKHHYVDEDPSPGGEAAQGDQDTQHTQQEQQEQRPKSARHLLPDSDDDDDDDDKNNNDKAGAGSSSNNEESDRRTSYIF